MSGGTISGAIGINDAGQVVGCSNVKGSSASDFFAFLWPPAGGMTNLGTLSGGELELCIRNKFRSRNRRGFLHQQRKCQCSELDEQ
jgi:probable HAF family extracellular repeat protein